MMVEADVVQIIGTLLGAFGLGWGAGFLLITFKKLVEQL